MKARTCSWSSTSEQLPRHEAFLVQVFTEPTHGYNLLTQNASIIVLMVSIYCYQRFYTSLWTVVCKKGLTKYIFTIRWHMMVARLRRFD